MPGDAWGENISRDNPCARCGKQILFTMTDKDTVAVVTVMKLDGTSDNYHFTCYTNQFRR